jgi:hypothetical protein
MLLLRWWRLGPDRRALVLRAVAALCVAVWQVRFMPFPMIAAGLGPMRPPQEGAICAPAAAAAEARAEAIRWAIGAAARRLPFDCACLVRALAAHALARESGLAPVLHLGAERGQQGTAETHAWLTAAGIGVTGYPLPSGMVEVGCFTA